MKKKNLLAVLLFGLTAFPMQLAYACTRVVYLGPNGMVITARSMDWQTDLGSNLWSFPRGMKRDGAAGPNSIRWSSRYGSVITAAFEACSADGMNEKGLVANLNYLAESVYPTPNTSDTRKPISVSAWLQYALDNYATVNEAVTALQAEPLYVVAVATPDGHAGSVHLALSDATGDSAIFEYVGGKLVIHHGREYQVMTNSPVYDQQLALAAYWQQIGGTVMLPGTNRAADRFTRASFYINAIPKTAKATEAVASVFSVIRNCSVPLGISTSGQPNISSTIWRTVADHKNQRYYFESTRSPSIFWVDLASIDFKESASVKRLEISDGSIHTGNAAGKFEKREAFKFLSAEIK